MAIIIPAWRRQASGPSVCRMRGSHFAVSSDAQAPSCFIKPGTTMSARPVSRVLKVEKPPLFSMTCIRSSRFDTVTMTRS